MSSNVINQSPFIRTTREFPLEGQRLQQELSRTYLDIAAYMNVRTIGLYPTTNGANTGNAYFIGGDRYQSIRKFFVVTSTADIELGFKLSSIFSIVQAYGSYDSGTSKYGLIYATNVGLAGQISFWIEEDGASTKTDLIKFDVGAGAPTFDKGFIVIEWLSKL